MKFITAVATSTTTWAVVLSAVSAMAAPPDHAGGGPTAITECQVIDESGSYVLAANLPNGGNYLTAADYPGGYPNPVNGTCILITVWGVDLDLAGHVITGDFDGGAPGSENGVTGGSGVHSINVAGEDDHEHINVYNGLITGFYRAINFEGAFFSTIENITAVGNDNHGISIHSGQSNHVRNNKSVSNDVAGIRVSAQSIITNNITNGNGGVGLFVDERSIVSENVAWSNGSGITVDCPSFVEGNVSDGNTAADLTLNGADCVDVNNVAGP